MMRAPATVLLIRHGETDWNRDKLFRGTVDAPLNDTGREQARRLAEALCPQRIDAAFTSPLQRAMETAAVVLENQDADAQVDDRLTDLCFGKWQGRSEPEVRQRWPEELRKWLEHPEKAHPPGGNTLKEVFARSFVAMEEIARANEGRTVAVFSHRVVNKLLLLGALGLGLERFPFIRQDNCCLNELRFTERGWVIVSLNDTSPIRGGGTPLLLADF